MNYTQMAVQKVIDQYCDALKETSRYAFHLSSSMSMEGKPIRQWFYDKFGITAQCAKFNSVSSKLPLWDLTGGQLPDDEECGVGEYVSYCPNCGTPGLIRYFRGTTYSYFCSSKCHQEWDALSDDEKYGKGKRYDQSLEKFKMWRQEGKD